MTTLAGRAQVLGYADGTGTSVLFFQPYGVAVDTVRGVAIVVRGGAKNDHRRPAGSLTLCSQPSAAYQTDFYNHLLRKLNLMSGLVTTLAGNVAGTVSIDNNGHADGVGTAASFYRPYGVTVDSAGGIAFIVS